jgi:hypothetical protein
MPEVNFNLLNPGAELYSGPQVTLDPVKAYETAQAKQQSNMLAQLYAKHYDPQTGGVNYNSLIGEAAQSGLGKYIPDIMGDAQKQSQSMAEIAQKRALQQQEEATAAAKQDEIRREKIKEMATESYGRFRGVKDEESLKAWHLANPELEGTNKAERTAKLQQDLKDKGYDAVRAEIEGSLQAITGIKPEKVAESDEEAKLGTYQPGDYTTASWAKFIKTKDPGVLALKPTASQIAASSAATTVAPKLKQGERWNPTQERVEQVPGSAEYIKQSKLHGNDYGAVQAVNSKTSLADKQIDRLLDTANEDAFNNLFGGYNAYVTQRFTGKTAGLKKDLDSLKQNLKSAGLELIKSGGGGAIGTITEREWPILEGMIESLDPTLSEDDARNKLAEIKAKMENLRAMAADKYETTWGETQYYKGGTAAPAAERTYTKEEQQALDWAKANPKDPRAAQIKAKLGVK